MSEEKLGPRETRADIRKWIENNPKGVSVLPSNFAQTSIKMGWSSLISERFISSGLKTLGVVRIEVTKKDVIAFPTPALEDARVQS